MRINDYDEYQDSFLTRKLDKIKEILLGDYWYMDDFTGRSWSLYSVRHVKRRATYLNDTYGPYRNWKKYRKNQYK
jgi:hypothetical protein